MSHLLVVTGLHVKALQRKGTLPLILEFQVAVETAPYLVSSSSSVMWITDRHPGNIVKAAVRDCTVGEFFTEVIDAVATMGRQQNWGNVHPLTIDGLLAAVDHVAFYDLGPLELLIPRTHLNDVAFLDDEDGGEEAEDDGKRVEPVDLMPLGLRPLIEETGLPFRPSSWVPDGTIVVVPKDRAFVGVVNKLTPKKIAGVVHNAARGIAIVRGAVQDELVVGAPASPVAD
jgi:hypothetical protein